MHPANMLFNNYPGWGSQLHQVCNRHFPKQVCYNAGYKKLEGLSPRQHRPQRQYQGQDSLIAALEEKYVLSQPSEALQNSSSSESLDCIPQEPIHMLGGMVSPHLVQAKASLRISAYVFGGQLFSYSLQAPSSIVFQILQDKGSCPAILERWPLRTRSCSSTVCKRRERSANYLDGASPWGDKAVCA